MTVHDNSQMIAIAQDGMDATVPLAGKAFATDCIQAIKEFPTMV